MRLPGVQPSPLKSTLPTIRNGEPMKNLEQEFEKATACPHNLLGTNRLGTCEAKFGCNGRVCDP
jgi:hypothetical protein